MIEHYAKDIDYYFVEWTGDNIEEIREFMRYVVYFKKEKYVIDSIDVEFIEDEKYLVLSGFVDRCVEIKKKGFFTKAKYEFKRVKEIFVKIKPGMFLMQNNIYVTDVSCMRATILFNRLKIRED